ncbi:hypothetical protein [Sporosarcina sp. G11-34]|uniref:hypothetical protein n=1 Tax=Sporosarcina sp. G11-34 TaxID=2849605 RepID=UPI0022A935A1|nr:hypothetical protein [Sporosarcina sp. G11-34]MCZ2259361.1 hypothetical protein [Sporosarcina sp. G11-34]
MKKLFNIGSSIVLDDFSSLRITGPYSLLNLGPNFATIKCHDYIVEAKGEDLIVDKLLEEMAVFSFSSIIKMEITINQDNGNRYDA